MLISENGICVEKNPFDYFKLEIHLDEFPVILEASEIKQEILKTGPDEIDPEVLIIDSNGIPQNTINILRVF